MTVADAGEVLAAVPRDEMAMRVLRKVHGELLLGDVGTKFVELAAHCAVVMFVTGAVPWWPRGARRLRNAAALPKGSPAKRSWWRKTHLFTGMLATVLIVPILTSGLPRTDVWSGGLPAMQDTTGQESRALRFGGGAPKSAASEGDTVERAEIVATRRVPRRAGGPLGHGHDRRRVGADDPVSPRRRGVPDPRPARVRPPGLVPCGVTGKAGRRILPRKVRRPAGEGVRFHCDPGRDSPRRP